MKGQKGNLVGRKLAVGLAMLGLLAMPAGALAQTADATAVSGRAYGVAAEGPVTIEPTPLVVLPATGGNKQDTVASLDESGITTGVMTVTTSGSLADGTSTATATVDNLAVSQDIAGLPTELVTATTIESTSDSVCNADGTATSTGDTVIEDLAVLGQEVTVDPEQPNQTVEAPLPGGVGSIEVVINEQIGTSTGNASALIVNALHITVTVAGETQEVVVASAASDVVCAAVAGDEQVPGDDQQDGAAPVAGDDQAGGGLPKTGGAAAGAMVPAGAMAAAFAGLGILTLRRRQ